MSVRELSGTRRAAVAALLSIAVLGTLAHGALALVGAGRDSAFENDWLYNCALVAAALACLCRGLWLPRDRWAWLALGIGLACWSAGDLYWSLAYAHVNRIPFPSPSDGLYLAAYPAYYVGILLLIRGRVARFDSSLWLDGAIGGLGAAALATAFLEPALVGLTRGGPAEAVTNLSYPVGDVLLLSFVVGALILSQARMARDWILIGGGLLVTAFADAIFLYQDAHGTYVEGNVLDTAWLVGGLLLALAAWFGARPARMKVAGYHSVFLPSAFAIVVLGLLVYDRGHQLDELPVFLAIATLSLVVIRLILAFGENERLLRVVSRESVTDALTGLGNRRSLLADLDRTVTGSERSEQTVFALFDLDGFKAYNDSFGHSAGDLLLKRMGANLARAVRPFGSAYRLGGDEFCVIADGDNVKPDSVLAAAGAALSEEGEGFSIGSSCGSVTIPHEAHFASAALRLADRRMYAQKGTRKGSVERQTSDVLLTILREREPTLGEHMRGVSRLAVDLGGRIGLDPEHLDVLRRAAELHDIGKMAIPDAILHKPGRLTDEELELVHRHTLIGERILDSAPAMAPVARLVRSSHERWDGAGYPDGLAGEEIPLGARIIFICDAFDAMVSKRPYREPLSADRALAELGRCAGTQFDPELVELFCDEIHTVSPLAAQTPQRQA
jgi:two-component system cell cycle response regulator